MKLIAPIALALILATPAVAQDTSKDDFREGTKKLGEALGLLFDGLSKEMEPVAEAWREMLRDLQDLSDYEAPETLPNGDIIIRRKVPLPEPGEGTDL